MRIAWSRYHVRLNVVGRSRWARGVRAEPTWSANPTVEDNDLWFIWAGAGKMRLRQGWVGLQPGICLWLRPGWEYQVKQDPENPLGISFLHFDLVDARGKPRPADAPLPPEWIEPPDPQLVEITTRRIVELCFGFGDTGFSSPPFDHDAESIGGSLLTGLLKELDASTDITKPRKKPRVKPYYDKLVRHIALRITENPQGTPSVAELANEFGYSPDHFSRIFKAVTGRTPELYAVQARLQRARRLLRDTALSVGEVATTLGYGNIYFFSRQFKQFTRLSPLQYRKSNR